MTKKAQKKEFTVPAIARGTVIDHIPPHRTLKVVEILSSLDDLVIIGVNFPSKLKESKGFVKIANRELTADEVNKIAIVAPNATVNIIHNFRVDSKLKVEVPEEIRGIVCCSNPNCITNHQEIATLFYLENRENMELRCHYCERIFSSEDISVF